MKAKVLSVLVVLAILAGCGAVQTPAPTPVPVIVATAVPPTAVPSPTPKLTKLNVPLGWLYNDEFVALEVADAKGFYREAGLLVNPLSGGGSAGGDPIIPIQGFDNTQRIAIPAAMSLVISAYAEGIDVIAVGTLTQKEPSGFLTLIKPDRRAQSPCDFAGKFAGRIVSMQTEAIWYVDVLGGMCQSKPLKSGRDFTVIPAGWTPDCLTTSGPGACDFYCAWSTNQPFVFVQQGMVEGKDYEMFLTADFLPFYFGDVIVTTKAYLKDPAHAQIVRAFVGATMKGLDYTLDHPQEAANISVSVTDGAVDLAHALWRIPQQNKIAVGADTKTGGLGYMDPGKVQQMIDFLFKNGQIKKSFKAEEVIDNGFLPGIKR